MIDSLGFLLMYVVYMLVAIIGRFVHQKMRRRYLAEALLHQVSTNVGLLSLVVASI